MLPADSSNPVHYFQAFSAANGIDWAAAQAFAGRQHGYLALINSAGENSFVFQLVADSIYWRNVAGPFEEDSMGPWLGGTQAANSRMTDEGWSWSNGRPFAYANWLSHTFNQSGEGESHLSFYGKGERNPQPTWSGSPKGSRASGFVVEYDRDPSLPDQ
jgi:hypothetical protein